MISYIDARFAYLVLCIPFVAVWTALYIGSPKTRKEQLHMTVVFAVLGTFFDSFLYFKDYWKPMSVMAVQLGSVSLYPESFVFGGAFAGIAAILYQVVSRKEIEVTLKVHVWKYRGTALVAFALVTGILLYSGVNSIYATAAGALMITAVICFKRHELVLPAIISGFLVGMTMFFCYSLILYLVGNSSDGFQHIWLLYGTSFDMRLFGIPVTELVWGVTTGSAIGVFHKFTHGLRFVSALRHETKQLAA